MSDAKLFEIIYSSHAQNDLDKDKSIKYDEEKIKNKIAALKYDPINLPNVKKLKGNLLLKGDFSGVYSMKFHIKNKSIRVTYEVNFKTNKIAIICVSERDDFYDKTGRLI